MSRDDSDVESSNPSKSFKVGDFDRLSGFFTPVWESKRRIRSESPIPASNPVSSKSGAAKPASKPTPSRGTATTPSPTKVAEQGVPAAAKADVPAPANLDASVAAAPSAADAAPVIRAAEAAPVAAAPVEAGTASRAPTKISKESKEASRQAPIGTARKPAAPALASPAAAPPPGPPAAKAEPAPSLQASAAARTRASAPRPSVAALKQAGPNLPAEAFLDPKPDFRVPLSKFTPAPEAERSNSNQRSLRASVAATRVHEQLRARAQADSFEAPELQWGVESEPEATAVSPVVGASSAASEEPHPLHLLRRLRRTIHLSTPLPEALRQMIARYGRN